ncbi:MAG TPA: hypothetical protein VFM88_14640 [Vicinamibacteria bacterium]|nr:hypothetical protein [Vicinamibacteria bacterium]
MVAVVCALVRGRSYLKSGDRTAGASSSLKDDVLQIVLRVLSLFGGCSILVFALDLIELKELPKTNLGLMAAGALILIVDNLIKLRDILSPAQATSTAPPAGPTSPSSSVPQS